MKLLRTIVIVPIFALATLTGAALPNVGVASASVGSLKYCVGTSQLNGSIMTLTTGDGPVYSYYLFIGRDGVGWEIAPWPPSFPLKFVAKGNLKIMVAKDEVRFEQVWPAHNSYGVATCKVYQQMDSWKYTGTWHMHNGTTQAFLATGSA